MAILPAHKLRLKRALHEKSMSKTTQDILKSAEETLFTAQTGFEMLKNTDAKIGMVGLRNLIVFGRAITNVLQNLRSTEGEDFDTWYAPKVEEMRSDTIMKYFYKLRSEILKQGSLKTSSAVSFSGNPNELFNLFPPPPNHKGFFLGDSLGGSGYEVEVQPGVIEKFYVQIPQNTPGVQITVSLQFLTPPQEIADMQVEQMCDHYLKYLQGLVEEAKLKFSPNS